jgi:hypothetical protein
MNTVAVHPNTDNNDWKSWITISAKTDKTDLLHFKKFEF